MIPNLDLWTALLPVVDALEALGVGVLRLQAKRLDRGYLQTWADRLGVAGLLRRALEEAVGG